MAENKANQYDNVLPAEAVYLKKARLSFSSLSYDLYKSTFMLDSRGKSMGKIAFSKQGSKLKKKSSLKTWIRLSRCIISYLLPNSFIIHCLIGNTILCNPN